VRQIESIFTKLGLSILTQLSILAVELLPGDDIGHHSKPKSQDPNAEFSAVGVVDEAGSDPLGARLGSRRILRSSSLMPVPPIC